MVDGDFKPIIRVTAATIIVIIMIIVFMDFTLFFFLIFISAPRWPQAAFFRLAGLFGTRALVDE